MMILVDFDAHSAYKSLFMLFPFFNVVLEVGRVGGSNRIYVQLHVLLELLYPVQFVMHNHSKLFSAFSRALRVASENSTPRHRVSD